MTASVLAPGPQTTLQGGRRQGYRHLGVPWSGAADPVSLSLANKLVENPPEAIALELTFGGLHLRFDANADVALTGAICDADLTGTNLPFHETIRIEAGQTLLISAPAKGLRTYLAIAGGWSARSMLGSSSTYMPAGLGGLDGRALQRGDGLEWGQTDRRPVPVATPAELRFPLQNSWALRATPSAEFHWLNDRSQADLFETTFKISHASNRMGLRLEGTTLEFTAQNEMKSVPVFPGTVQCPSSGAPIALLADGQTTGGYPRICNIIRADRHLLGQIRPSDSIRLLLRTITSAREDFMRKQKLLSKWIRYPLLY
ncbi:MAG: biotin-dependent carboxyltransferase family protein [Pseudomonadota bacterium]